MWIHRRAVTRQSVEGAPAGAGGAGSRAKALPRGALRLVRLARVSRRIRAGTAGHADSLRRATVVNGLLFGGLVLALGITGLVRARHFTPVRDPDVITGKLAKAFEHHYNKTFPIKNLGVNLWAAIDYGLFREGRSGVVVGRNGWLYTDEEFELKENSRALIDQNLALIDWVRHRLARRHVGLLVAVVPAKARVYPEHLDDRKPPPLRQALYTRTLHTLRGDGIPTVGLLKPLRAGKHRQLTFFRTDTHWTPYGARLAAQAIASRLADSVKPTDTFHTVAEGSKVHRGDLFNYLPLRPWFGWMLPPPDRLRQYRTVSDASSGSLLGSDPAASVALVGTSYSAEPQWNFAGALEQAMHTDVLNYAKAGEGPMAPMMAYLHSADFRTSPPKLVIWEVPERYLPLRQKALAAYHLPADAFVDHGSTTVAEGGRPAREGGSTSHVTSKR